MNARTGYTPLSDLGRALLPASREAVKEEQHTAEIIDFAPRGYPLRLRVIAPPDADEPPKAG
jgi:hypothetical protein